MLFRSSRGINVTDLRSGIRHAPGNPDPLFHASADIELPEVLDVVELRRALEMLGRDLGIEYALTASRQQAQP